MTPISSNGKVTWFVLNSKTGFTSHRPASTVHTRSVACAVHMKPYQTTLLWMNCITTRHFNIQWNISIGTTGLSHCVVFSWCFGCRALRSVIVTHTYWKPHHVSIAYALALATKILCTKWIRRWAMAFRPSAFTEFEMNFRVMRSQSIAASRTNRTNVMRSELDDIIIIINIITNSALFSAQKHDTRIQIAYVMQNPDSNTM